MRTSGECKCGTGDSCVGNIRGSICDARSSQCMCSKGVQACKHGEYCKDGVCSGRNNHFVYLSFSPYFKKCNFTINYQFPTVIHFILKLTDNGRNGVNLENVYPAVVQVTRNELESVLVAKETECGVRVTIQKKLAVQRIQFVVG